MKRRDTLSYAIDVEPDAEGWWSVERIAFDGTRDHARVRMEPDHAGRLEVRELHLLDNGEPITAQRLRAYSLGTVAQMIGAIVRIDEARGQQPKRRRALKPPASRGYDDAFYERVAFAYRAALAQQEKPVAAIAAEAGVPRSTAARWVKEARRRPGVSLGPASPGKAGEARA
jgi:hypothetical protein